MCILYHISVDDRFKSMFAYTDCIPQVRLGSVYSRVGGWGHRPDSISIEANSLGIMHEKKGCCEGRMDGNREGWRGWEKWRERKE